MATPQITTGTVNANLTGQQKAAIIVRLLLSQGSEFSLHALSGNHQVDLVHQMADMNHIDEATVASVVEEFLGEFPESGLSFPIALEESLEIMGNTLSPETSRSIRRDSGLTLRTDPWDQIKASDTDALLPLLDKETVEVAAVILAKIKVSTAAELLGHLPGEKARRITYTMSQTNNISPKTVRAIGASLAEQLDNDVDLEFEEGPAERIGAILNFSPAATREDMLEGLQNVDAALANQVRQAIFTFANIPERLSPRDVPAITRKIDAADVVTALVAAQTSDENVVEFILSNMSRRMADQIREEMADRGEIGQKDGEAAMTDFVSAIREMADDGEIFLITSEE